MTLITRKCSYTQETSLPGGFERTIAKFCRRTYLVLTHSSLVSGLLHLGRQWRAITWVLLWLEHYPSVPIAQSPKEIFFLSITITFSLCEIITSILENQWTILTIYSTQVVKLKQSESVNNLQSGLNTLAAYHSEKSQHTVNSFHQ